MITVHATRDEYGQVINEVYPTMEMYGKYLELRNELRLVAAAHGYDVDFCEGEGFNTCVNVSDGNGNFCATSSDETTVDNIRYCLSFVKGELN